MPSYDPRLFLMLKVDFARHPNYMHLNRGQKFMIVEALLHCVEFKTDGFVAQSVWSKIGPKRDRNSVESCSGITVLPRGLGIQFDNYFDHNPSRDDIEEYTERRRSAGKKGGQAKAEAAKRQAGAELAGATAPHVAEPCDFLAYKDKDEDEVSAIALTNASASAIVLPSDYEADRLEVQFAEFWSAYPLKRGKPKAKIAFRNAVKRAAPDVIISAARSYREDPNRRDEFTKWPQGWLNDDRWNDGPLPDRNSIRNSSIVSRADIARQTLELGNWNNDDDGMKALA